MPTLRPSVRLFGMLLLVLLAAAPPARAADVPEDIQEALEVAEAVEKELIETCRTVRELTVAVLHFRVPRDRNGPIEGAAPRLHSFGSGVLIERKQKTWVITNVHVVQGADAVAVVTADGEHREVTVHDSIPAYDIALLAFPKRPRGIRGFTLNPSKLRASRYLEEGAWVVATGNPFGLSVDGESVTTLGVVSGLDRVLGSQFLYGSAIQHDAAVNPGNSGGPLWDRKGDLLGINGMIMTGPRPAGAGPSNTGASFTIPIHQVNEFLSVMMDGSRSADAGFLGLQLETAVEEGRPSGATVKVVHPQSPAGPGERTGLKPGDVITSIWGLGDYHRVRTASEVTNILSFCKVGTFLKVKYKRGSTYYEWSGQLIADPTRRRRR